MKNTTVWIIVRLLQLTQSDIQNFAIDQPNEIQLPLGQPFLKKGLFLSLIKMLWQIIFPVATKSKWYSKCCEVSTQWDLLPFGTTLYEIIGEKMQQ